MKGKKHVYCVHFNYKTLQKNLLFSNFFSFKCNFCYAFSNKKILFLFIFIEINIVPCFVQMGLKSRENEIAVQT